jgi:hypothetical protein
VSVRGQCEPEHQHTSEEREHEANGERAQHRLLPQSRDRLCMRRTPTDKRCAR